MRSKTQFVRLAVAEAVALSFLAACGAGGGEAAVSSEPAADAGRVLRMAEGTWSPLASEGQDFTVSGTQTVRYGAGSNWIERTLSGGGSCSNGFFGSDPIWGVVKACQVSGPSTPVEPSWSQVANEGGDFTTNGLQTVRYGSGSILFS